MEEKLSMEVTSIKIKKVVNHVGGVLAYVSIGLNDCIAIHGIRIIEIKDKETGNMRKILAFPSKKINSNGNGENVIYSDIVHPTNNTFRRYLEEMIFNLYEKGDVVNG